MKTPRHTPGPWIAPEGQVNLVCRKADWECQQVGALANGMQILTSLKNGEAQAIADARLVAAAPDLLSALEYAVELLTNNEPFDENDQAILERAIAKAKGGAG